MDQVDQGPNIGPFFCPGHADIRRMLNRLPSDVPSFRELAKDIGFTSSDTAAIARALGVSVRTVWTWWASDSPKTARLALWWLSHAGHNMWDVEMANRTQLAVSTNRILWNTLRSYDAGTRYRGNLVARHGRQAANDTEECEDLRA